MRLVIIESPFAGDVERNLRYVRACMADCLRRGEAPFASHALYTQRGVLDDTIPEERKLGIDAGLAWGEKAEATVVYRDFGITPGMRLGIERADACGRPVEIRFLGEEWDHELPLEKFSLHQLETASLLVASLIPTMLDEKKRAEQLSLSTVAEEVDKVCRILAEVAAQLRATRKL